MKRLGAVLFWSVISAAFIGPGTVTTAARSGSEFGLRLLWALAFSTLACWALQESSARLTISSGHTLGEALARRFSGRGPAARALPWLAVGAVVLGCAAYEAGNILGAVAGAALIVDAPPAALTLVIAAVAGLALLLGSPRTLAVTLGLAVAVMGVAFLVCALLVRPDPAALVAGLVAPRVPSGSGTLVLGLIGTTVVPYNLFLGSGLARGRSLAETRWALAVAIGLGGVISMGVLVAGTAVTGGLTFESLAAQMDRTLAPGAGALVAVGLLAAGLSSATTAPLAAGLAVASLVAPARRPALRRLVSLGVLGFGVAFGVAEASPIPVIVLAQAANGLLLPLVALFLLLAVNDVRLVGRSALNGTLANVASSVAVYVTLVLGARSLLRASASALGLDEPQEAVTLAVALLAALLLALPVGLASRRARS